MDPILGGLLSGGASILGSILGSSQNNQNALAMQQQAEAYNTQMSNTAYQRASADMTKAGLNPMMMFSSGSAASSPQIQPAQLQSAAAGIGPAMQSAIATATQQRTANATIDNLVAENAKIKADALTASMGPTTEALRQSQIYQQTEKSAADTRLSDAALTGAMNDATRAANELELRKTEAGKLLDQAGMAGRKVSDIISPVSNIVSSAKNVQSMLPDN